MPLHSLAFWPHCDWTAVLMGGCIASRWNEAYFSVSFPCPVPEPEACCGSVGPHALHHAQWLVMALYKAILGGPRFHGSLQGHPWRPEAPWLSARPSFAARCSVASHAFARPSGLPWLSARPSLAAHGSVAFNALRHAQWLAC